MLQNIVLDKDFLADKEETIQVAINSGIEMAIQKRYKNDAEGTAAVLKDITRETINEVVWEHITEKAKEPQDIPPCWFIRQAETIAFCMIVNGGPLSCHGNGSGIVSEQPKAVEERR